MKNLSPEEIIELVNQKPDMIEANLKTDWNKKRGGTIHLDGEMDFPKDLPMEEIAKTLAKRAEVVGGLVRTYEENGEPRIKVSCQFGAVKFILKAEEPTQPVQEITSIDDHSDKQVTRTIKELEALGQTAEEINEWLESNVEKGNIEWTIEKSDDEPTNIMDL